MATPIVPENIGSKLKPILSKKEPLDLSFDKYDGRALRLIPPVVNDQTGTYEDMWDKNLLLNKLSDAERLEYKGYNENRITLLKEELSKYLDSLEYRQNPLEVTNYYLTAVISWDDSTKEYKVHEFHHLPIKYAEVQQEIIIGADYVYNGYTEDEMMIRDGLHGKRKR